MNDLGILAMLSELDDDVVLDAYAGAVGAADAPRRPRRQCRFGDWMNNGWVAAGLSAVVALGILVAIIMAGQGGPDVPPVGTNHGSPVTEEPNEAESLSPEEAAVRAFADQALLEAYPSLSSIGLDSFRITIVEHATQKGQFRVRYEYHLCGLSTSETYTVRLFRIDSGFTLDSCDGIMAGDYTKFHCICSRDNMEQAKQALTAKIDPEYATSGYYLGVDQAGNLILQTEQIVDIITPGSLLGQSGCGIDHEHKFHSVIVCRPDDPYH